MSFERENIRRMSGYLSGEQLADDKTIKLNTNENPFPPCPGVSKVLEAFRVESLRRYPPATAPGFCAKVAALHGLAPENIIATRGGDELLRLAITTFVAPGQPVGMTNPTYSLYPVLAQIQDCPIVQAPLQADWSLPTSFADDMNAAGVRLTLLVNPHAPSGTFTDIRQISALANRLDSLLLLDEAYIDFAEAAALTPRLIHEHDNLIILRTLSKGYSLAGIRFGYGLAASSLISPMLTKTRDSYNLDSISQQIAEAAIGDQDYARGIWTRVIAERRRLRESLAAMGLPCPASEANFLLVTVGESAAHDADEIYQKLKQRHILVRHFDSPPLADKLRISVGTPEENDQLLRTLADILGQP